MARETALELWCKRRACILRQNTLLRELAAALLFCVVVTSPLWAADSEARRQAIETMTPAEKADLATKYQNFLKLSPEEQQKIRQLYDALEFDKDGDRLRGIMQRYYDWLASLDPNQQEQLIGTTDDDKRVALIAEIRKKQQVKAAALHMAAADSTAIDNWVKAWATAHPAELQRHTGNRLHGQFPPGEEMGERFQLARAYHVWAGDKLPNVSPKEIDDLAKSLTPKKQALIDNKPTFSEKAELVHDWLKTIAHQRLAHGFNRQGTNFSPQALAKFFQSLPKDEQQKILSITDPEEQKHEIRRRFMQSRRSLEFGPGAMGDHSPPKSPAGDDSTPKDSSSKKAPHAAVDSSKD